MVPRTDPCPPHVVCADSGIQAKEGTINQARPAIPANQRAIIRQEGVTELSGDRAATPRVAAPWSPSDKKKFYDTADVVRAKFATSDVEGKAIFDAVRSGNKALVHSVLIRNGFTEQQLDGAGYLLQDNTGGRAFQGGIKVQLAPECCPLVLIVGLKY